MSQGDEDAHAWERKKQDLVIDELPNKNRGCPYMYPSFYSQLYDDHEPQRLFNKNREIMLLKIQ